MAEENFDDDYIVFDEAGNVPDCTSDDDEVINFDNSPSRVFDETLETVRQYVIFWVEDGGIRVTDSSALDAMYHAERTNHPILGCFHYLFAHWEAPQGFSFTALQRALNLETPDDVSLWSTGLSVPVGYPMLGYPNRGDRPSGAG